MYKTISVGIKEIVYTTYAIEIKYMCGIYTVALFLYCIAHAVKTDTVFSFNNCPLSYDFFNYSEEKKYFDKIMECL